MGQPKQLLDWFGRTFIEQVVLTARQAKLDPIIVVTGAYSDQVEEILREQPVILVRNEHWENGQSSSLIAGVHQLEKVDVKPFVFMLCDQPQIPVDLVKGVIRKARLSKAEIVITEAEDGNFQPPIYFSPVCIDEIKKLEGDQGGKKLTKRFRTLNLKWPDNRISLDCDTIDDYKRMIEIFK